MFGKNKCPRCKERIEKEFSFCPYCGLKIGKENRDEYWNDGFLDLDFNSLFSNIGFGNLFKEIEKQFSEIDKKPEKIEEIPSTGISISISSEANGKPIIKVRTMGREQKPQRQVKVMPININEKEIERISKLPRQEAETKVRRLTNKIVYEIELPGVDSLKNININKLENSIEIKAFTKNKAYFKLIPVSLPLLRYSLKEGRLVLELKPQD